MLPPDVYVQDDDAEKDAPALKIVGADQDFISVLAHTCITQGSKVLIQNHSSKSFVGGKALVPTFWRCCSSTYTSGVTGERAATSSDPIATLRLRWQGRHDDLRTEL